MVHSLSQKANVDHVTPTQDVVVQEVVVALVVDVVDVNQTTLNVNQRLTLMMKQLSQLLLKIRILKRENFR